MSDYTWLFDDTVSPTKLIGQTTLSAIQNSNSSNGTVGVGAISGNWYPSGSVFYSISLHSNASFGAASLRFFPFYVTKTTIYTDIGILPVSSTGTVVLGLYNDSGANAPTGSPIAGTNSGDLTPAGGNTFTSFTFSSPVTLAPGIYWPAYAISTTFAPVGPSPTNNCPSAGVGMGVNATPTTSNLGDCLVGWKQTFTYSSTLPAVGSLVAQTANGTGYAYIFLKAQ